MALSNTSVNHCIDLVYQTIDRPDGWAILFDSLGLKLDTAKLQALAFAGQANYSDTQATALVEQVYSAKIKLLSCPVACETGRVLLPHIQRAIQLKALFTLRMRQAGLSFQLIDAVPTGMLLADDVGEVVHANPAAQLILRTSSAFMLRANKLWSPDAAGLSRLRIMLGDAANTLMNMADSHAASARIMRRLVIRHGEEAVHIKVVPVCIVPAEELVCFGHDTRPGLAALLVTDLKYVITDDKKRRLMALYQLSKSELKIACLVAQGLNVSDMAEALAVSTHTIRSQLKAVFKKTTTRKQSELVQLIFNLM